MKRLISIYICLAADLQSVLGVDLCATPIHGCKNIPRLLSKDDYSIEFGDQSYQNHSVLLYLEDSALYVGGANSVLKLDMDSRNINKIFPLNTTGQQDCSEGPCENVITVMEKFEDRLFVCGTNGQKPQCWKLSPSVSNQSREIETSCDGTGISPFSSTQNSLSLTADGDLYAAAPLEADGSLLEFRRKAGKRTKVWMHYNWASEPTFIAASWVKQKDDPDNEKIYIFFREKNSDTNPEADPWISRVARVCKVDEGGSKQFLQNIWTSFLKARLICGFPKESLYFNRLHDIFVLEAEDWRDTRVYGLFTSSWNSTAVCIYTIEMIEKIFENSPFKGYNKEIPKPRPGTCTTNSKSLPRDTVAVVKDYPEMTGWVHSLHHAAPFYISSNNYTKIVVDRVQAADNKTYNVLLLSTDTGNIHKVLEAGSEPLIISEIQLSNNSTIHALKLDSKKKKLIVGFSERISVVDLQRCQYNSCAECVLGRDPYCAWTTSGCVPTVPDGIQNIVDGNISVCPSTGIEQAKRTKRDDVSASAVPSTTVHSVPLDVPFYLSCPIDSYHAVYTWRHEDRTSPCLQMHSDCLHLITKMTQKDYGDFECVSTEKDYTKVVKKYQLTELKIPVERNIGTTISIS
ncbi:semaphorin-7A [Mugil cephalus]|uniref:semaphorin-7A n=1 Tax=Mugil cephalus TaxID=48193 RepID=UPI001FB58FD9|nr:semaphorin-7A [Mugil cephalus]